MLNRTVLLIEISEYRCWQLAIDWHSTLAKLSLSSRTQRQWQWATIATGMLAQLNGALSLLYWSVI